MRHAANATALRWTLAAVFAVAMVVPAGAAEVRLPKGWSLVPAGDRVQTRGLVMHLSAGVVSGDLNSNMGSLRSAWGEPVIVRTDAHGTWLSKSFDPVFATVQFSRGPTANSTRVVLSKVNIKQALAHAAPAPWTRMPAGSRLRIDTESADRDHAARHVSYANGHSAAANRDYLVQWLGGEGHTLQSDIETPPEAVDGRLLMFARGDEETTVVIRHARGVSTVTLNQKRRTDAMKGFR